MAMWLAWPVTELQSVLLAFRWFSAVQFLGSCAVDKFVCELRRAIDVFCTASAPPL